MPMAFVAAMLLVSQPPSTDPSAAQAAPSSAKPAKAERKVCKTLSQTGSRLPGERLCLTEKEWKKLN